MHKEDTGVNKLLKKIAELAEEGVLPQRWAVLMPTYKESDFFRNNLMDTLQGRAKARDRRRVEIEDLATIFFHESAERLLGYELTGAVISARCEQRGKSIMQCRVGRYPRGIREKHILWV